jgi:hypothetical protein
MNKELNELIFLHCGKIKKRIPKDINYSNLLNKPKGLWLDEYDIEKGSEWLNWSFLEMNRKYKSGYLLQLKKESNIYIIRNLRDYFKLFSKNNFLDYIPTIVSSKKLKKYRLDFNKVALKYDGIYILDIDLIKGKFSYIFGCWDAISLVLFNHNCYKIIKKINLSKFY